MDERYLAETAMLDYSASAIQTLIENGGWQSMGEYDRIGAIYAYVRDEILFGYNIDDDLPASRVLRDGYGQCNTKATLLMALLRAVGIPCRIHGFTIDKALQKGAMTGLVYRSAPKSVLHSWTEVWFDGHWVTLEGVILDRRYLYRLWEKFSACKGAFCGYGAAVKDFSQPPVDWNGGDTFIQSEGINRDFGVYDSPDELLKAHHQDMPPFKAFLYRHVGRRLMNHNVKKIRGT